MPIKRKGQSIIHKPYRIVKKSQQGQSLHVWTSNVCKTIQKRQMLSYKLSNYFYYSIFLKYACRF